MNCTLLNSSIIQTDLPYNSEVYTHTSKQGITAAKSKSPTVTVTGHSHYRELGSGLKPRAEGGRAHAFRCQAEGASLWGFLAPAPCSAGWGGGRREGSRLCSPLLSVWGDTHPTVVGRGTKERPGVGWGSQQRGTEQGAPPGETLAGSCKRSPGVCLAST